MVIPAFLTTEMDNGMFFNTLATTSTVFILVMTTFAIHRVSTINADKRNKKHEIYNYELEISRLKLDNERKQAIIDMIVTPGNTITEQQQKKHRKFAQLIMDNNTTIEEKKQRIEEHNEFMKRYEKIEAYLNNSIKYLYIFPFVYIVVPLVLLSFPNFTTIVIKNFIKLVLIVSMILFILKIIKDCKDNLLFPDFLKQ